MRPVILFLFLAVGAAEAFLEPSSAPLVRRQKKSKHSQSEPWAEILAEEGVRAHASIGAYLKDFFASTPAEDLSPAAPVVPQIKSASPHLAPRTVSLHNESGADAHLWTKWNETQSCTEYLSTARMPHRRRYLVIAPVGSAFDASVWLTHSGYATYDIIALYYGSREDFECPLCKAIIRAPGTKWFLMNNFLQHNATMWAQLEEEYSAVMVADDDLLWGTCTLNR